MNIIDDFKVFRDQYGLNQLDPNTTSQNGTLFTVEYLICLLNSDQALQDEKRDEIERIKKAIFPLLEKFTGLSIRFPSSGEYESMDNTVALLTFSVLHDEGRFGQRMFLRAQSRTRLPDEFQDATNNIKFFKIARLLSFGFYPKWVFNNQHPSLFCSQGWFGRSPAMVGLVRMVAKEHVSAFNWLSVLVGQFLGCLKPVTDSDSRKLAYVTWQYLKTRSWFWKKAYQLWCWKLMKDYPNGMKDIYNQYYRNPRHPIKVYSKCY